MNWIIPQTWEFGEAGIKHSESASASIRMLLGWVRDRAAQVSLTEGDPQRFRGLTGFSLVARDAFVAPRAASHLRHP